MRKVSGGQDNLLVATGKFGGKAFVARPTLTVRLDPMTGTWGLYSGSQLLTDNLRLIASRRDNRQFAVGAEAEGAWVIGLVFADDNPLYEDANGAGVDDGFERQKLGALLTASATLAAPQQLAKDWMAWYRAHRNGEESRRNEAGEESKASGRDTDLTARGRSQGCG